MFSTRLKREILLPERTRLSADMEQKLRKIRNFEGLCAATFTAFDKDGNVNPDVIDDYVRLLQSQGVGGAFVNGTTGEGLSMTVEERKKLAEKWASASKGKLELLIVHISANSIVDTKELAKHAEELDVDAISLLPPFYYRCPNTETLIAYIKEVSSAAPRTPILYYHIPTFTGVNVKMCELLPEASKAVPAFCGAKYSCNEFSDLAGFLREEKRKFKLFFGYEEVLLASLSLGVTAAIGGTFSYQGRLANKIMKLYKEGDIVGAQQEQDKLKQGVDLLGGYGCCVSALKTAGNQLCGIDFGCPRSPLQAMGREDAESLGKKLKGLGITLDK